MTAAKQAQHSLSPRYNSVEGTPVHGLIGTTFDTKWLSSVVTPYTHMFSHNYTHTHENMQTIK